MKGIRVMKTFRLHPLSLELLEKIQAQTGKTKTEILEDALSWYDLTGQTLQVYQIRQTKRQNQKNLGVNTRFGVESVTKI
ncbi:MAG: hypothetical protein Q7S92_05850 [Candidatus Diapherotrites archaeon]|nr:hypothetical protein [Candidatus Diapherotrites archaeon]